MICSARARVPEGLPVWLHPLGDQTLCDTVELRSGGAAVLRPLLADHARNLDRVQTRPLLGTPPRLRLDLLEQPVDRRLGLAQQVGMTIPRAGQDLARPLALVGKSIGRRRSLHGVQSIEPLQKSTE
jgi:hypothetical protein